MKKNNKGFSVITVIVAIAFIGIMAMIVLYMSMSNFHMKVTDLKAKNSFYKAENALDEIKSGLQADVGEAMADAYVDVLENYEGETAGKQAKFQEKYVQNLRNRLKSTDNSSQYDMEKIKGYVDMLGNITKDESLKVVNPEGTLPLLSKGGTESGLVLKNLKVIYVDPKGRASIIETDIRLGMPHVTFPDAFTPPDLMKMNTIAGRGIVCGEENAAQNTAKTIQIKGNVYAGQQIGENGVVGKDGISLEIKDGQDVIVTTGAGEGQQKERLVCLGEIGVGDNGSFVETGAAELWAQGLKVTSGRVELTGTTYFADDLTLNTTPNTSRGSEVKISGEYYGYGSSSSAKGSHFAENKYKGWTNTAMDSAMIINGKGTVLDLSGVTKFMLAGNSYIDLPEDDRMIFTGESLTVKGNQLAYLVDPDCFVKKEYTNPMSADMYMEVPDDSMFFDMDKKIEAWGGQSMNEIGLNPTEPFQKFLYNSVGGVAVYFYLNFSSAENASKFFESFYNTPVTKANMDKYLNFYLGKDKGIVMNPEAIVRFETKGNTLVYNGGDGTNGAGALEPARNPNPTDNQFQEQVIYQNMWYALTKKMIPAYDRLKDNVKKDGEIHHSEKDPDRTIFQNTIDEERLKAYVMAHGSGGVYSYTGSAGSAALGIYIVDNEGGAPFVIDSTNAANTKLVVATGDVTIEGVSFTGVIMAKGMLNLKPGSTLDSQYLEASKAYQSQIGDDAEVPMDFFWDGNQYLLGAGLGDEENSDIEEEKKEEEEIYDLSECITFEYWKKK